VVRPVYQPETNSNACTGVATGNKTVIDIQVYQPETNSNRYTSASTGNKQ
jgi:hypothetical protein